MEELNVKRRYITHTTTPIMASPTRRSDYTWLCDVRIKINRVLAELHQYEDDDDPDNFSHLIDSLSEAHEDIGVVALRCKKQDERNHQDALNTMPEAVEANLPEDDDELEEEEPDLSENIEEDPEDPDNITLRELMEQLNVSRTPQASQEIEEETCHIPETEEPVPPDPPNVSRTPQASQEIEEEESPIPKPEEPVPFNPPEDAIMYRLLHHNSFRGNYEPDTPLDENIWAKQGRSAARKARARELRDYEMELIESQAPHGTKNYVFCKYCNKKRLHDTPRCGSQSSMVSHVQEAHVYRFKRPIKCGGAGIHKLWNKESKQYIEWQGRDKPFETYHQLYLYCMNSPIHNPKRHRDSFLYDDAVFRRIARKPGRPIYKAYI